MATRGVLRKMRLRSLGLVVKMCYSYVAPKCQNVSESAHATGCHSWPHERIGTPPGAPIFSCFSITRLTLSGRQLFTGNEAFIARHLPTPPKGARTPLHATAHARGSRICSCDVVYARSRAVSGVLAATAPTTVFRHPSLDTACSRPWSFALKCQGTPLRLRKGARLLLFSVIRSDRTCCSRFFCCRRRASH